MFDDLFSYGHLLLAMLCALVGVDVAATIAYLAYQYLDADDIRTRLGDIAEWVAGLIIGGFLRVLLQY